MIFSNIICSSLTPLHVASEKSHLDAMELLIKGGAKVRGICYDLTMISHLVLERFYFNSTSKRKLYQSGLLVIHICWRYC